MNYVVELVIKRYMRKKNYHLKTTRISEKCPGPVHKTVKAPKFIN